MNEILSEIGFIDEGSSLMLNIHENIGTLNRFLVAQKPMKEILKVVENMNQ